MCKWLSEQGGSTAGRLHSLRWSQHRRWGKPGSASEGGRQRVRPAVVFSMRHGSIIVGDCMGCCIGPAIPKGAGAGAKVAPRCSAGGGDERACVLGGVMPAGDIAAPGL